MLLWHWRSILRHLAFTRRLKPECSHGAKMDVRCAANWYKEPDNRSLHPQHPSLEQPSLQHLLKQAQQVLDSRSSCLLSSLTPRRWP